MESNSEYIPTGPIWIVFDIANGHKPSKRYNWWFDTKKDALAHIKHQKTIFSAAPLSKPYLFKPGK